MSIRFVLGNSIRDSQRFGFSHGDGGQSHFEERWNPAKAQRVGGRPDSLLLRLQAGV